MDSVCQTRTGDPPLRITVANDRSKSTTMLLEMGGHVGMTFIHDQPRRDDPTYRGTGH